MPVPVIVYALLLVFEALLPLEQGREQYSQEQPAPVPAEVLVISGGQITERYYLTAEGRRTGYVGDVDSNRLFAFETLQRSAHMYVVYPATPDDEPTIVDLGPVLEQFRDPRAISRQLLHGARHPQAGDLGSMSIERIGLEYYVELHEPGQVLVVRPPAVRE